MLHHPAAGRQARYQGGTAFLQLIFQPERRSGAFRLIVCIKVDQNEIKFSDTSYFKYTNSISYYLKTQLPYCTAAVHTQ